MYGDSDWYAPYQLQTKRFRPMQPTRQAIQQPLPANLDPQTRAGAPRRSHSASVHPRASTATKIMNAL